jgi:AraC family transcriptional regulator
MVEPTRFADGRPMLLAGIRRFHDFVTAGETVGRQWREFERLDPIPGRVGGHAFGAMCQTDPENQRYEYMCAAEVSDFEALPAELGRMRVPEAHYAVFTHSGHISSISDTWRAIITEWVPNAGIELRQSPDFELYDERFDPKTEAGEVEIWIPLQT